jgi:hypothetical protein
MTIKAKKSPKHRNLATAFTKDRKFTRDMVHDDVLIERGWAVFQVGIDGVYEIEGVADGRFSGDDLRATAQAIKEAKNGDVTALKAMVFLLAQIAEPIIAAAIETGRMTTNAECGGTMDVTVLEEAAETAGRAVY